MTSIFLSHNAKDKPFVRDLAKYLGKEGIKTWVDEAEIKIGDSLIEKISAGITDMNFLGAVLSPNSVNSNWVKKEIEIAMTMEINGNRIKVLPILYKECEIPIFLIGKRYCDFTGSENFLTELDNLINVIKGASSRSQIKRIDNKAVEDADHFDKIKFVFNFANSLSGLNMGKDSALQFAENWAKQYSISKIKKIIYCFNFANSLSGLNMGKDSALQFALSLSNKYSAEEISKLIDIFNFANSLSGLNLGKDSSWNYATNKLKVSKITQK